MTNLISATGHDALFRHTPANGKPYVTRRPVIAWDEHGNAYVHDQQWGGLRRAGDIEGYRGTQTATPPVVSAIPATGWMAEYDDNGTKSMEPVIAWLVHADGGVEPVSVGLDGGGFDPSGVDGFIRLIGPGELS